MLSVNINGNLSKLESKECLAYMIKFDVIALVEIKCSYVFSVPGFEVIRSAEPMTRGGVAVLIKHNLWSSVYCNQAAQGQVWFNLSCMPDVRIGACYIPPADSPYFDPASFSDLQSQILESGNRVIMIGDFNSRMSSLKCLNDGSLDISYSQNVDRCDNAHGRVLLNMCANMGVYPVNHLNLGTKCFTGSKTFRKRDNWISQLDWLFVSSQLLHTVCEFAVDQQAPFRSDHAALQVTFTRPFQTVDQITERAALLDRSRCSQVTRQTNVRKAVHIDSVDADRARAALPDPVLWWRRMCDSAGGEEPQSVDELCNDLTDVLYDICRTAQHSGRVAQCTTGRTACDAQSRWQMLLNSKDPKLIWSSINWSGKVESRNPERNTPSDDEFCCHFEGLLNPTPSEDALTLPRSNMYVPVLDDPITPQEVKDVIRGLRRDKAAGVDGVPPGILKLLDGEWLNIITYLFNMVFDGSFPEQWSFAKVFTIFKKGNVLDTNNYRGISIQSALAKVYDGILNYRFIQWFKPDDEQAGGRQGRGCAEHLFTLRLLIDYVQKTKQTLYIAYIDYIKAYDKLNRGILLQKLADQGCGRKYLAAIANSLRLTKNVLGNSIFTSSVGVKQGAANSCSLFTFYVNSTVKAIKVFGNDGFLKGIHSLLFMDDTVVLATSREAMQRKLTLLHHETVAIKMEIHPDKSKFMVINSKDDVPFIFENIVIRHTHEYIYLGTPISNSSLRNQVKAHIYLKQSHLMKFSAFLKKNKEAPFPVKELVFKSALSSAVLYGCESWLCQDLQYASSVILSAEKQLLSVRNQTCSDLVRAELGYPDLNITVKESQIKFMRKLTSRNDFEGSPAQLALHLAVHVESQAGKYVSSLLNSEIAGLRTENIESLRCKLLESESSRRKTYCEFNPDVIRHPIYTESVPEYGRIAFTRIRLGSHRLKIETGRWSRIPQANRLCPCGAVQSEKHVLLHCPESAPLRECFPNLNFNGLDILMSGSPSELARLCHMVLDRHET